MHANGGLVNVDEIEAIKNAYQTWNELPGAFNAVAHCEAIGRKA